MDKSICYIVTSPFISLHFQILFCKIYCREVIEDTSSKMHWDDKQIDKINRQYKNLKIMIPFDVNDKLPQFSSMLKSLVKESNKIF